MLAVHDRIVKFNTDIWPQFAELRGNFQLSTRNLFSSGCVCPLISTTRKQAYDVKSVIVSRLLVWLTIARLLAWWIVMVLLQTHEALLRFSLCGMHPTASVISPLQGMKTTNKSQPSIATRGFISPWTQPGPFDFCYFGVALIPRFRRCGSWC